MATSRVKGFYRLPLAERRAWLAAQLGLPESELELLLEEGGMGAARADQVVENVVGTYALPFCLGLNFLVDGRDRLVPMVVEEPSVVAAASNAAKMVRAGGGFVSEAGAGLMIGQIELREVQREEEAQRSILEEETRLLALAAKAVPGLVRRGGGPRRLEVRRIGPGHLVVHLLLDPGHAMGANLVNSAAEALAPELGALAGARVGLRILSNLADQRLTTVRCEVPSAALVVGLEIDPGALLDDIEAASIFAERDPYRAATHNKGIMNGIDSVVIACGNDFRSVEAGAHAYAAHSGTYSPLSTWRRRGDVLLGELTLPLALGTVGGTLRTHRGAQLALRLAEVDGPTDLSTVVAAAGLASNLAALRALASEGIQRGHMALHARSVAVAAGAQADEVELVAARIAELGQVEVGAGAAALARLREKKSKSTP
jgi:hydroxymethylglutaryl-CoA reductase